MDIFAKIAAGEIPSYKVAENDEFYAFLDINPLVKGHTLVIPRREVDYFFDMDDDELARYQAFAKRVAKAIKAQRRGHWHDHRDQESRDQKAFVHLMMTDLCEGKFNGQADDIGDRQHGQHP